MRRLAIVGALIGDLEGCGSPPGRSVDRFAVSTSEPTVCDFFTNGQLCACSHSPGRLPCAMSAGGNGQIGQILSLPKGGGALHGMGEKFSPDLHTGTGNFTIPLFAPPGRNGFQPQLSLVYSTGHGNGAFGLGFDLSVPGVTRKTSRGIPRYDDAKDVFILSGAEDLVPVETTAGVTRYRPRTEGLFARVLRHHDAQNDYWEVQSKDGLVSVYGGGSDPAVVADPANRSKVFSWRLSETHDPFGNRIQYEYERDLATGGERAWDQLYLKRIRYADYGNAGAFLVSITFEYEDRADPFSDYRAGFEIRTRRRCTRIDARTHAEQDLLCRSTQLVYQDQLTSIASELPLNGASLLRRVQVVGHDGTATEALPPLELGYTAFNPKGRRLVDVTGSLPPASLANPDYELVDLFGQGLPDLLELNGVARYWRNLGQGRFDLPHSIAQAPPLRLSDPGVQMLDANGDGRPDLLVTTNELSGFYPLLFGGLWSERSFQRHRVAPTFNLKDPELRLVDLTGDGVTDVLRAGSRLECFFNDPQLGWHDTREVERHDGFPGSFSDPRVKWADLTGDGLTDVVVVYDGSVEYWPNRGYGDFGPRIVMKNCPRLPYGYDPKRVLLGDVDGDGLADLVYVGDREVLLCINRGGNAFSDPIVIEGTPPVSDLDAIRLTDLLGCGVAGVLYSTDATVSSRARMSFLDFTGGVKPYLLAAMDNHSSAVTRVEYAPSTRFYLMDQARCETHWQTPLPFPVQVVAKVEVTDAISRGTLTTEYRYHHGYWDGAEREFRGFGRVDQRDTSLFEDTPVTTTAFSPPTETRTWFHQGAVGDEQDGFAEADYSAEEWPGDPGVLTRPAPMTKLLQSLPRPARRDALRALRGSVLRTELYALDGSGRLARPYTVTEHAFGVREESALKPGESRPRIFFPHGLAQRTTQWERGNEPMTQFAFTGDYDPYGQARSQIAIAVARRPGQPHLATRALTTYATRDDDKYLVDRVATVTTQGIPNNGSLSAFDLRDAIEQNAIVNPPLLGHTLSFYDGPAFQGLGIGLLGDHGALSRTETLVFTDDHLRAAYDNAIPPYLVLGAAWTTDYPSGFQSSLPSSQSQDPTRPDLQILRTGHGYGDHAPYLGGYYVTSERREVDALGLLLTKRDALGRDTSVQYDSYRLLPIQVTDAAGLTTRADYDYRVLAPKAATDPNGNLTSFAFTPLGQPAAVAVLGKGSDGDTLTAPGTRFVYDYLAYQDRRQPISVRTIQRLFHVNDTTIAAPERDQTLEKIEYSDGFGRLLQTRTQAEDVVFGDATFGGNLLPATQGDAATANDVIGAPTPAGKPRVTVSGWQIYDNKGQVVEKYEPFFSTGWDFHPPADAELGQKISMYYDPRGHVIRTINPDQSTQTVLFGTPLGEDPNAPLAYRPTPWEAYTYDANDNAGRTHKADSNPYSGHWDTPSSIVIDALGRTVEAVQRNHRSDQTRWFTTRSTYDIQGNLLKIEDALGRKAFAYAYDLAKRPLRTESLDGGVRRVVLDAAGKPLEQRDSKGALVLRAYDVLGRPTRLWARDDETATVTLRERIEYGDAGDAQQPAADRQAAQALNMLGKPVRHYDEAGRLTFGGYDFKGILLEKTRRTLSDAASAFRVNWDPVDESLLEATVYATSMTYDALSRLRSLRAPTDVSGKRKQLLPRYNRAGALESVSLDGADYVRHIAYNAKGQRTLIAHGNGILTRYAHDPKTFRLVRMRSERCQASGLRYRFTHSGNPLQDFAYQYDLSGDILAIQDRTPGSGVPSMPDSLDRKFTYDAIYRLLTATGREAERVALPPWDASPRSTDVTKTQPYMEEYSYDKVGNLEWLKHESARVFDLVPGTNRLKSVTIGQDPAYGCDYDKNGNLVSENTERFFEWDHADRMKAFRVQAGNAQPSKHAQYLYGSGGQRVKKLVRKGTRVEVTVYIDGLFEHQRWTINGTVDENNIVHVMDGQQRVALVRVGEALDPQDSSPSIQYQLGDHLGSSNLVIDDTGAWLNREEFTPYGETSFGGFALKRYRLTGKERDDESGLSYHSARYYAPWLGRWTSQDPIGGAAGINLFVYSASNPIKFIDRRGTRDDDVVDPPKASAPSRASKVQSTKSKHPSSNRANSSQNRTGNQLSKSQVHNLVLNPDRALKQWERLQPADRNRVIEGLKNEYRKPYATAFEGWIKKGGQSSDARTMSMVKTPAEVASLTARLSKEGYLLVRQDRPGGTPQRSFLHPSGARVEAFEVGNVASLPPPPPEEEEPPSDPDSEKPNHLTKKTITERLNLGIVEGPSQDGPKLEGGNLTIDEETRRIMREFSPTTSPPP